MEVAPGAHPRRSLETKIGKGQLAAVGGRREPWEADSRGTAIREVFEETPAGLGSTPESAQVDLG